MGSVENHIFQNTTLLDLTLYQYGRETCDPLHLFGPAVRNHYLLHFVLKGKGTYHIKDRVWHLSEGQAFLIIPGVPTTYYADETDPWTYIWVEFDGLKALEYLKRAGISEENPIYVPMPAAGSLDAVFYLNEIINHAKESSLYQIGHFYLFMDALIKHARQKGRELPGSLKDFYMKEAVYYIEEHYAENITIEDLAAWCSLNRNYFSKIFKDSLKITPQEFLMRYRMGKACDLLTQTGMPINEVASSVGYVMPLHFSRAFKKMYGISPRSYRNGSGTSML